MSVVTSESTGRGMGAIAHLFLSQTQGQERPRPVRQRPAMPEPPVEVSEPVSVSPTPPTIPPIATSVVTPIGFCYGHLQADSEQEQGWWEAFSPPGSETVMVDPLDPVGSPECSRWVLCCTSHSEAILATYRLIKRWVRNEVAFPELSLWMGQASDEQEARAVYLKIQQACQRFLEVGLAWEGHLAEDPADLDSREQDFFAEMGWSATGKPGLSERLSVQPAMTIPRLPATREELLDLLLKLATSQPFQNMRFSPLSVPLPQSLYQAGRLVLDARQRPYVLTAVTDDDRDRWTGGLALSQWFQDNLELIGGYCRVTLDPLQKPGMVVLTSGPRGNEFKTLSSLTGMSVYHAQFLFTEINQILAMILA